MCRVHYLLVCMNIMRVIIGVCDNAYANLLTNDVASAGHSMKHNTVNKLN